MAEIVYKVPLVGQCNSQTCWYSCLQMIIRWYRTYHGLPQGQWSDIGRDVDTTATNAEVCRQNRFINPASPSPIATLAGIANMNIITNWVATPDIGRLRDELRNNGPLLYAGIVNGYRGISSGGHVVVIYGCDDQADTVFIADPEPVPTGTLLSFDRRQFFSELRWPPGTSILYAGR